MLKILQLQKKRFKSKWLRVTFYRFLALHLDYKALSCGNQFETIFHPLSNLTGFPLRPIATHQLLQATHSDVYRTPHEGVISQDTPTLWQKELSTDQVTDIERVCEELMTVLRYDVIYRRKESEEKRKDDDERTTRIIYGWL